MPRYKNSFTGEERDSPTIPQGGVFGIGNPWKEIDSSTGVTTTNQGGVGANRVAAPLKDVEFSSGGAPPGWELDVNATISLGGPKKNSSGTTSSIYQKIGDPSQKFGFADPSTNQAVSVTGAPGVSQRVGADGTTIEYKNSYGMPLSSEQVLNIGLTASRESNETSRANAETNAGATLGAANISAATSRAIATENIEAARLAATALSERDAQAAKIVAAAKLVNDTAAIKKIDSDIQRNSDDTVIAVRNLQFAEDKNAYANSVKNVELSRDSQKDIFAQQTSIANLKTQQAQMFAQRDQAQATLNQTVNLANAGAENETGRFNTTQQFNVQRANEEAARARQQQLQSLGTDIGKLAADPGDRAKYASTVLANSGWGRENTAMAGQDLRTTDSMAPLEALLRQRESVQGQTANPYTYTPLTASKVGKETLAPIDLSGVKLPSEYNPTAFVAPVSTLKPFELPRTSSPSGTGTYNPSAPTVGSTYNAATNTSGPTTTLSSGQVVAGGWGMAYGGGTREEEFIVGDSRSGRPTGYEEIIVNPTHAPIHVIPNHNMSNYFEGTMNQYRQMPRYAEGAPEAPSGDAIRNYLNAMTQAGKREEALKVLADNGYKMDEPEAPPAAESRVPNIFERTDLGQGPSEADLYPEQKRTGFSQGPSEADLYSAELPNNMGLGQGPSSEADQQYARNPRGRAESPFMRDLGRLRGAVSGLFSPMSEEDRQSQLKQYRNMPGGYSTPRYEMGTPSYAMGTSCPTCGSPNFANGTMPVYADGTDGVFGGLGADTDRSLATSFLNDASSRARAGTPWSQGNLPTSVYASSPGFNPSAAKTLASIRAQATGQSSEDFLRSADLYKPGSVSETSIGRRA